MILEGVGTLASGIGSWINSQKNYNLANQQLQLTKDATLRGLEESIRVNDLNYQLQKENLDYQKSLQKVMFEREDNAVQRRVNDLKAAGLSPVLAAGSSANAGPVISTSAPQRGNDLQGYLALAQVGTMIANQQRAQTEADIARQTLNQSRIKTIADAFSSAMLGNDAIQKTMDTRYFAKHKVSPTEANFSWQQRLVNLIAPKVEELLLDLPTQSVVEQATANLGDSGVHVDEKGDIVNKNGQFITATQASLLKQKGLYSEWLAKGFSPRVVKALDIRLSKGHYSSRGVVHGGGSIGSW